MKKRGIFFDDNEVKEKRKDDGLWVTLDLIFFFNKFQIQNTLISFLLSSAVMRKELEVL